ncbi:HEPN domain-containing protein [Acuticoccus sp. MNP-M23]|uniref:HEPN domain-containing protein n=1 Tax=Acuticoccus sp. MNP-M23 TaxID=3072793 RepID=UPI0028167781|nr:HEPN domain-containing protein [Acuticoccus sp. MNP-M23]WMS40823.1 HEPN domain-containing protein [Acuticoccus sp. MNP-M23]
MNGQHATAIEYIRLIAGELAGIKRAKHYALWRDGASARLTDQLGRVPPFSSHRDLWIHTGDGRHVRATARTGEWVIDRLVEKMAPDEIFATFDAQVATNSASYVDASPVFGIEIDAICDLGSGITIVPTLSDDPLEALRLLSQFQSVHLPTGTAILRQTFIVTPAFHVRSTDDRECPGKSDTAPPSPERDNVRARARLACLLASNGPVELPLTVLEPHRDALFVARERNSAGRPFAAHPKFSRPVAAQDVKRIYGALAAFDELDSLARSIDRLGRARLASSPVDRALELGIASEIALMHGHGEGNAEITHKIGTRAAWLLGRNPSERETIFAETKRLYTARSQAVHTGVLSPKSKVDLDAADELVRRVLRAILEHGRFPIWANLTLGGDGSPTPMKAAKS